MSTDMNWVRAQSDVANQLGTVSQSEVSCEELAAQSVPFADCFISPAARAAADRVLASGWVTTGAEVAAFEREYVRAS